MKKWNTLFVVICFALFLIAFLGVISYPIYKNRSNDKIVQEFAANLKKINTEKALRETTSQEIIPADAVRVPILVYHSVRPHYEKEPRLVTYYDVAPEVFEKQLRYFKDNGYHIVSLDALANALSGEKSLPPKPIIFTFDDGWENQYKYALPLLKKYEITATFFIFTNAIGHKHFLNWKEIYELDAAGMTIGAHTKSHPYLFQITDSNRLRDEVIGSKKILEDGLNKPINFFAYPFGYYNDKIISIVREAGFTAARSSKKGIYHTADNIYRLRSIEVSDDFDKLISEINK